MELNKSDKIEIFENAISWVVVFAMTIYGLGKLVQFDGATKVEKTVAELSGMELMWAFYGYSIVFAVLLGVFELIGAALIFFKKTRLIGCLFTSTILVNIIIQDVIFGVNAGALQAAIFYQTLILLILVLNKDKLIIAIKYLLDNRNKTNVRSKLWLKLGLAFVLFVLLRLVEMYFTSR